MDKPKGKPLTNPDMSTMVGFMVGLTLWAIMLFILRVALIVAGIIGLLDAVQHGPQVWNLSLAVLATAGVLRYIVAGVGTRNRKKRDKVEA